MSYNTIKDKLNVHELHNMLVQEEMRLKNQRNQGAGNKFVKKHNKSKRPLKINDDLVQI